VPTWLIAPLIVAAALLAAWWADTKVTIIVTELKAIREDLDKLWTDQSGKDDVDKR
jgi:hypothetical protein